MTGYKMLSQIIYCKMTAFTQPIYNNYKGKVWVRMFPLKLQL